MTTLNNPSSWIIYNTMTTQAVFETFEPNTAKAFANGIGVYRSIPALEWLQMINAGIKMAHERRSALDSFDAEFPITP